MFLFVAHLLFMTALGFYFEAQQIFFNVTIEQISDIYYSKFQRLDLIHVNIFLRVMLREFLI